MTFETIGGGPEKSGHEFSADEIQQAIEARREARLERVNKYKAIMEFAEQIRAEIPTNEKLN